MKRVLLFWLLFFMFIENVFASTNKAHSYVLMDMTTGRVLAGKNYNTPYLIAIISKIMTCLLAIESNKLDEIVVIDDDNQVIKTIGKELKNVIVFQDSELID